MNPEFRPWFLPRACIAFVSGGSQKAANEEVLRDGEMKGLQS